MNFFSAIPSQLLETTITNALLQGLSNPSRKGPIDPTPYMLYQMRNTNKSIGVDNYTPPTPLTRSCNPVMPTNPCPPAPRIHNRYNY
jgi:hypothetical protein